MPLTHCYFLLWQEKSMSKCMKDSSNQLRMYSQVRRILSKGYIPISLPPLSKLNII